MILQRLTTASLVMKEQGPRWVAERVGYSAKQRLGIVERATPLGPWNAVPVPAGVVPSLVAIEELRTALRREVSSKNLALLETTHDDLESRYFDYFGQRLQAKSWHWDPVAQVEYPSSTHWSRIPEDSGADLKHVWEPSRFAWTYNLIRLFLIDPDSGADETWWSLFEDWCAANPPNAGINWSCGQEASIRLMAVTCALSTFQDAMSENRWELARAFAVATGQRVQANIAYARLQRNNHLSSEAAGLLTAALIVPDSEFSEGWIDRARRELDHVAGQLIFADGGSSQYSMNYHRVFIQGLIWSSLVAKHQGIRLRTIDDAAERSVQFTWALVQDENGYGPRFGHDDGANILPTKAGAEHRDLRPVLELASSLGFGNKVVPGQPADGRAESANWFRPAPDSTEAGGSPAMNLVSPASSRSAELTTNSPSARTFADTGISVLRANGTTVYGRATDFVFRPAHSDQLSIEVWHRGSCLVQDLGTHSYKQDGQAVTAARSHSTITIAGQEHMKRVSRFLFAGWTKATSASSGDPIPTWRANHQLSSGVQHTRVVRVLAGGAVSVEDSITCEQAQSVELAWCPGPDVSVIPAPADSAAEVMVEHDWVSSGERYGSGRQSPIERISSAPALSHRFVSLIDPETSSIVVSGSEVVDLG